MNRTCLKHMSVPGATEVTGVLHFLDKSRFLAVGWNRRITTFPDVPDVSGRPWWEGLHYPLTHLFVLRYSM